MGNRHLSRSIVMQSLFEWDFSGKNTKELDEIIVRNIKEFAPDDNDNEFIRNLAKGVIKNLSKLDDIITKAAPEWPIEKIAVVDRNILRIGLYELLFSNRKEVPPKVAINESIELAKGFGGESSGRFVNGVLGSVYKELGEPGKEETTKKKIRDIPYEEMPIEKLGGAVVYAKKENEIYFGFVHDVFGHWTLSKGKIEKEENEKEATIREIKEEINVDIKIKEKLGSNEYIASDPEKGKIRKQVVYFLAEAKYKELNLGKSGGLDDAKWFKLKEIVDLNFYDDILPIITKAVNILLKNNEKEKIS
ncbi:transcription antitermination factor NusB [Patescibacteria group bacterium]|nr:transcription antitermination factor NusB [Patescibacteria group bacterium]MBU4057814.1 transcription antitermination factor NusB [Patescibacteria group bacterium]MBU4115915.1 transcription antitermination factor NusB [Patescibacteria group bacterium]